MKKIGTILTESNTTSAMCQLFEHAERGNIQEGKFLIVNTVNDRQILSRVTKLLPRNDFFIPGDAWTEARRKEKEIPTTLARKYELCELELLREIPNLTEVKIPPYPGDIVSEIDITKDLKTIFGIKKEEGILWYGNLLGYKNAPIPLDVEAIPMHMGVFGVTGSGKSYDVGALIEKLVQIKIDDTTNLSLPMVIIDANGDYIDYYNHYLTNNQFGACPTVFRYVFPNSPLIKKHERNTKKIALNINNLTLRDVSEIIVSYYSGGGKNELQVAGIEQLFENLASIGEIKERDYQVIFTNQEKYRTALSTLNGLPIHQATRAAIQRGLQKFLEVEKQYKLFSETAFEYDNIEKLTKNREIAIFDFSADGAPGIPLAVKQLVLSYISTVLFNKFTDYKIRNQKRYLLFIIEESQNYCPNLSRYDVGYSLAREKLHLIATQGRKFGLSLCLVSQRPSFIDSVVLSMMNTFFIHRIAPDDVTFIRRASGGLPSSMENRLTRLSLGELIITGQMNVTPFPMIIRVKGREIVEEHQAGKTEVIGSLRRLANE
ncbi:MAG: ATP-binding protein [Candidatus Helarchaeota archaeon]